MSYRFRLHLNSLFVRGAGFACPIFIKISLDRFKNSIIIFLMNDDYVMTLSIANDIILNSIKLKNFVDSSLSFFTAHTSLKRGVVITYLKNTDYTYVYPLSPEDKDYNISDFHPSQYGFEGMRKLPYGFFKARKDEFPYFPFEEMLIYSNDKDDETGFLFVFEIKKIDKNKLRNLKKFIELFIQSYLSHFHSETLEWTKRIVFASVNMLDEGIVVIKNDEIILRNRLGGDIIRCIPEILKDKSTGERIISLEREGKLRSFLYKRKVVDDTEILIFNDITEKSRLLNTIFEMRKIHMLGELTAGVAHEINNPLQIILGFAQLARHKVEDKDDELKNYIDEIIEGSIRVKKVIGFLSSYMEEPAIEEENHFKISEAIKIAYDAMFSLNDVKGITISYYINDDFLVKGELHKVVIAIENLLMNSFESIKIKGNKGRIEIKSYISEGKGIVDVEDDGIGIKEEDKMKIFDTFFTTKKGGAGLGLGIVKRIMQIHNGDVKLVDSKPERTIFRLTFPIE